MNLFPLLTSLALLAGLPAGDSIRWVVEKTSSLDISGRTNVSRFSCSLPTHAAPDTISFVQTGQAVTLRGVMRLSIADFDCHSRMMTGDLRKTLKADVYPDLILRFIDLERMPASGVDEDRVRGWVEITLAGVCRRFCIDYSVCRPRDGAISLTGARDLCFSDFGLAPPQKMCGLVKVSNTLQVRFTLALRKIP